MSIFFFKEKDGTESVQVSGYLTNDAVVRSNKFVTFSVCYGKKKYIDCKAWLDKPQGKFAACLEKHDQVRVDGAYEPWTNNNGEQKPQILVDFVSVQAEPPSATVEASPSDVSTTTYQQLQDNDDLDEGDLPF